MWSWSIASIGRGENESEKHPENCTDSARGIKKFTKAATGIEPKHDYNPDKAHAPS